MQHFFSNIQGWSHGLESLYQQMVDSADSSRPHHYVEVGSWKGRSAAYMCVAIINSGKTIAVDCVDTWAGSLDETVHQQDPLVVADQLYDHFIENLGPVQGHYQALRMASVDAALLYADHSLDFVCIDAQHDFASVCADIRAWLPKIRPGGVLAGDDLSWEGVRAAVEHCLGSDYVPAGQGHCWLHTVK
jgi:predicted O-methyltransferase YrrM